MVKYPTSESPILVKKDVLETPFTPEREIRIPRGKARKTEPDSPVMVRKEELEDPFTVKKPAFKEEEHWDLWDDDPFNISQIDRLDVRKNPPLGEFDTRLLIRELHGAPPRSYDRINPGPKVKLSDARALNAQVKAAQSAAPSYSRADLKAGKMKAAQAQSSRSSIPKPLREDSAIDPMLRSTITARGESRNPAISTEWEPEGSRLSGWTNKNDGPKPSASIDSKIGVHRPVHKPTAAVEKPTTGQKRKQPAIDEDEEAINNPKAAGQKLKKLSFRKNT